MSQIGFGVVSFVRGEMLEFVAICARSDGAEPEVICTGQFMFSRDLAGGSV